MKSIELIHPKTGSRRMVPTEGASAENRLACLKRAGFVPAATYRAPKKKVVEPEPTLAEKVEEEAVKVEVDGVELEAEIAVHGEGDPLPEDSVAEPGSPTAIAEDKAIAEAKADEPKSDPEPEKELEPEKKKPFGRSRKKKTEDK